jgi:short-subunit dehydrogenase
MGATGGIGEAISVRLAHRGFRLHLLARDQDKLDALAKEVEKVGGEATIGVVDLSNEGQLEGLGVGIRDQERYVDCLIHAAGHIELEPIEASPWGSLRRHFSINFEGPYFLSRNLIEPLIAASGQIVFVNSSAVQFPNPATGQYTASKHALKGFADTLRAELNPRGVRVLSIFPGRTATSMQRTIHAREERDYSPERLMQPEDVAEMIEASLKLPPTAEVTEIHMRPMRKDN